MRKGVNVFIFCISSTWNKRGTCLDRCFRCPFCWRDELECFNFLLQYALCLCTSTDTTASNLVCMTLLVSKAIVWTRSGQSYHESTYDCGVSKVDHTTRLLRSELFIWLQFGSAPSLFWESNPVRHSCPLCFHSEWALMRCWCGCSMPFEWDWVRIATGGGHEFDCALENVGHNYVIRILWIKSF